MRVFLDSRSKGIQGTVKPFHAEQAHAHLLVRLSRVWTQTGSAAIRRQGGLDPAQAKIYRAEIHHYPRLVGLGFDGSLVSQDSFLELALHIKHDSEIVVRLGGVRIYFQCLEGLPLGQACLAELEIAGSEIQVRIEAPRPECHRANIYLDSFS